LRPLPPAEAPDAGCAGCGFCRPAGSYPMPAFLPLSRFGFGPVPVGALVAGKVPAVAPARRRGAGPSSAGPVPAVAYQRPLDPGNYGLPLGARVRGNAPLSPFIV